MHKSGKVKALLAGFLLLTSLLTGCAEGPLWRLGTLSPWIQKKWAEEEKYGKPLYQRRAEVRKLGSHARNMPDEDQQRISQQLADIVKNEPVILLRIEAIRALGSFRTTTAAQTLHAAITDGDAEVRIAACQAWQRRGDQEALDTLRGVVGSDTDIDVRLAATRSLGAFRSPDAIQALGLALDDGDPALQNRAMESLKLVSGKDYGNDTASWREFVRGGNPPPREGPSIVERLGSWF